MKKRYILSFLIIIVIAVVGFFKFAIECVYVNDYIETANLKYIANTLKDINTALDGTMRATYVHTPNLRFLYKNASGSVFIKNNPIPNNLDYEVGINLGKFSYDKTKPRKTADEISELMGIFEYQFYEYMNDRINPQFYTDMSAVNSLINVSKHRLLNEKIIENGLINLENKTDIHTIGVEAITLYGRNVKFNEEMAVFPRKINVYFNYYADLENPTTKTVKRINLIPQAYDKIDLSKRFFIPGIYVGETAVSLLRQGKYAVNDEDYFKNRITTFSQYIDFTTNDMEYNEEPLKMYKALIQTNGIIAPALYENQRNEVYRYCKDNLGSNISVALNDYIVAYKSLKQISTLPNVYKKMNAKKEISIFSNSMRVSLNKIQSEKGIDYKKLRILYGNQNEIEKVVNLTQENGKIEILNNKLTELESDCIGSANALLLTNLKDKHKFVAYLSTYKDILNRAGYHKILLYPQDDGKMGVLADKYTSTLTQNDFKQIFKENGLANKDYILVTDTSANEHASILIRYKPTQEEQLAYSILRNNLIQDKANFKIKRKILFVF